MINIGERIRGQRIAAGLTQQNVADLMLWTLAKVSRIENGHQQIKLQEYIELVEILESRKIGEFEWPNLVETIAK